MSIKPPLQVVLCWQAGNAEPLAVNAARAAIRGASVLSAHAEPSRSPTWAVGKRLELVEEREISDWQNAIAVDPLIDRAHHTLVVVWGDSALVKDKNAIQWINTVWNRVYTSSGQHGLLIYTPNEETRGNLTRAADAISNSSGNSVSDSQITSVESLGEPASRMSVIAMRVLEACREQVATGVGKTTRPTFFISHAKNDGLSAAQAILHAIEKTPQHRSFYDVRDIPSGHNWKSSLETNVQDSVLIAIRTNEYESRSWCLQEYEWAESAGVPVVVVDARTEMYNDSSILSFDTAPTIRISDGNLARVLYSAVRENLSWLLLRRGVNSHITSKKVIAVLPRRPTFASLLNAIQGLPKTSDERYIIYPDPKIRPTEQNAIEAWVGQKAIRTKVLNYTSYLLTV